jgi:hypothetical protein
MQSIDFYGSFNFTLTVRSEACRTRRRFSAHFESSWSRAVAEILAFVRDDQRPLRSQTTSGDASEVVVFPRTNIRELRKLWGLPEEGLLIAGPDGRAIGALEPELAT